MENLSTITIVLFSSFCVFSTIFVLCLIWRKILSYKIEKDFARNPHIEESDGKKRILERNSELVGENSARGSGGVGKFRKTTIDGKESYVTYFCEVAGPIVFTGEAYRVVRLPQKWHEKLDGPLEEIIGPAIEDPRERTCVKLFMYGNAMAGTLAVMSLLFGICTYLK